eukprot:m.187391 g.187391  ORF g.187391 m.187391 type:complete len:119 (-) comp10013_c0_seq3:53-409(-)
MGAIGQRINHSTPIENIAQPLCALPVARRIARRRMRSPCAGLLLARRLPARPSVRLRLSLDEIPAERVLVHDAALQALPGDAHHLFIPRLPRDALGPRLGPRALPHLHHRPIALTGAN